jgi:hypothetical protein
MTNQKQAAELAQLRSDHQELENLRASVEESKKASSESESGELTRLREDNKDLLKLRSEVQRLRVEKDQMAKQVQTAQAQSAQAQAQAQAAQAQAQNAQQQAQTAQAQAAALKLNVAPEARTGACINYLRQIEAAKQQWAQANGKTPDSVPTDADIAQYLPNKVMVICPAGGAYSINAVNMKPTCNIAGHVLP